MVPKNPTDAECAKRKSNRKPAATARSLVRGHRHGEKNEIFIDIVIGFRNQLVVRGRADRVCGIFEQIRHLDNHHRAFRVHVHIQQSSA